MRVRRLASAVRRWILAACMLTSTVGVAAAQNTVASPPPARAEDVEDVDAILAALYDVISGPRGEARDWDRLRSLFLPGARMIPTGIQQGGSAALRFMSVDEYVQSSGATIEEIGFREQELARRTERFGNIVHAFSTYAGYREGEASPLMRGINSIQLFDDGSRWWIVNILWQAEHPGSLLPEKYLRPASDTAAEEETVAPTTILLVRHAEPGTDDPRDPGLSAAGRERARSLLDALRDANVSAIYTSQFRRTRETARPLAEQLEIPLEVVAVKGPDLAQYNRALLERIRTSHPGETVLVVGHSNTVPAFVRHVTGRSVAPIGEAEFDRLYVVTIAGDHSSVIPASY